MARITINETVLDGIADAIRDKLDTDTQYAPQAMAAAISSIEAPNLMTGNIIANGEYTPSGDKNGFSSVTVNVPNSYAQSDEGKVVSNGTLVSQTSTTKIENGTYDTTLINSVTVNVAGQVLPSASGVSF